jgi:hypothetical protein
MKGCESMKRELSTSRILLALCALVLAAGCGERGPANSKRGGDSGKTQGKVADHGHDHAHCLEGPHGGQLIELEHAYHAEIVADEKNHQVTVYLLDGKAKDAVSIARDEPEIFINAVVDGKSTPHRLTASPQSADPEGQASRFELTDVPLFEALFEKEGGKGSLRVMIGGKQFVGQIEHCEHDEHEHHDDHDHKKK